MSDPVSGVGKKALEEVQKSQQGGVSGTSGPAKNAEGKTFDDVMSDKQVDGAKGADQAQDVQKTQETNQVEKTEMDKLRTDTNKVDGDSMNLEDVMNDLNGDHAEVEKMMEDVMNGKNMDQKELLKMQGMIYQYSQKVKLTSKVVEKGTGGLKKMLNMQV